jgi:hypothetical protein
MALIVRIVVILVALFLASIVSGMVAAAGLIGSVIHGATPGESFFYWSTVTVTSAFTLAIGFLPLLIVIAVTEALNVRAFAIYAVGGALLMVAGYYASGAPGLYEESIDGPPPLIPREAEVAATAGAAFGTVYWLIAGRRAGAWRQRG